MIRLLSKTFSNRNQIVTCFLKLFDRIWKDFMSVKKSYQTTKQKERKQKENYTLVPENDIKDIQPVDEGKETQKETYRKPHVLKIKSYWVSYPAG